MMDETKREPGPDKELALDDILNEYRSEKSSSAVTDDYRIPEAPHPAPRRGSLPTEEEVRAYLASYARGEAEPSFEPKKAPQEPDDADSRFLMGRDIPGRNATLRYGSREIDLSADESYRPPQAEGFIATHSPDKAENAGKEALPRWKLLSRAKEKLEDMRIESAEKEERRRAAKKIRYPEPKELVLPGEEAPEAPARSEQIPVDLQEPEPQAKGPEDVFAGAFPDAPIAEKSPDLKVVPEPEPEPEPVPEPEPEPEPVPEKEVFTPSWTRSAASTKAYASLFPDTSASPALYAEKPEGPATDDGDATVPLKSDRFFPANVREYLITLLTTVFYGMRKASSTIQTAEEDDEDLGPEATTAFASKYYGRQTRSQRLRLRICGVLLLIMAWISLGLPVSGQLANIRVAAYFCLCLQLGIMLLCQDVLTGAVLNAFRRKPGVDSMAVLACLVTSLDALLVGAGVVTAPHLPFCLISSLSLTGVLLSSLISCRGLRKSFRVPSIAKRAYTVTGEMSVKDHGTTILKSVRPPMGFVRRCEQSSPDEDLFRKLSVPLLILTFALSFAVAFVKKDFADIIYIFSAVFCPAAPFAAMCCYSLPFFLGSMRIFPSGAAIAGWSGMSDIGQSKNLIVTDRDLFPDGTVEIGTIRIFANEDPMRIISYAGSMMAAAGGCAAPAFGTLMERNDCRPRTIENFEFLAGGGMKGVVDGHVILCGSTDLMRLMNVRIPFRLVDKTSVLLSVDGTLCGIFNIKYTAKPQVREALIDLMRSNRHPVFAIRDFNVTPEMLHVAFDVATDGYDFPPYVDRFEMSSAEPSESSQIAAIVCREGLGPLVHAADTARSIYSATRINTALTALSALLGVIVAAVRLFSSGSLSIAFLLAFMLFFALLTALVSFFTRF